MCSYALAMSTEPDKTAVHLQYFEIRNSLNRANRIKNLKTELEFEIRKNEEEYFIIIKSTGAQSGFRIAVRYKDSKLWTLSKNEIYEDFYKYMYLKIRTLNPDNDININSILTDWLSRLWIV